MKKYTVAVLDSGGRGHALAWACRQDPRVDRVIVMPGNAGMLLTEGIECIEARNPEEMLKAAEQNNVDITIVGAEQYLRRGVVDLFEQNGRYIIGPSQAASILESSKGFTDNLCKRIGVAVPKFEIFFDPAAAKKYVTLMPYEVVVKCDGLAEGKGSIVCDNMDEAFEAIDKVFEMQAEGKWGGDSVVIQERIYGKELTATFLTDGDMVIPFPLSRDYKQAFDGNQGKNTGGMGCFSPHPWEDRIRQKTTGLAYRIVKGLREHHGIIYKGFLYIGLMFEEGDPFRPVLLEINVRLGDPETEVIVPRVSNFFEILLAFKEGSFVQVKPEILPDYFCDVVLASGEVHIPGKGRYPGYPGRYAQGFPVTGLDSIGPDCLLFSSGLTRHPEKGLVTSGGRVLHIVGKGQTLREARQTAYVNTAKISFEGARCRRDIGS